MRYDGSRRVDDGVKDVEEIGYWLRTLNSRDLNL